MRTTVTIDPDVEVLLKEAMRERHASFKHVLNDGLRRALGGASARPRTPFQQPAFDLATPLVDLAKATALAAELEDLELAARLRKGR